MLVAAYLLGSVPASYLAAKLYKGIDLREYGSGNVGASNLLRATSSKPLTAIVTVWDLGKGTLMVWVAEMVGLTTAQYVIVGLAAIAGHNWTVFLCFKGGRGVLTTLGVAFFLEPWNVLVFVAIAAFTLIRMASPLPVLLAIAAMPLVSWLRHEPLAITLGLLAMWLIMVLRRLTVPRTSDVPFGRELLLNRLFFDREIKDGRTWVTRKIDRGKKNQKGADREP